MRNTVNRILAETAEWTFRAMYLFLAIAGLYSVFIPSQIVTEAIGLGVYIWSAFMLVGGIVAFASVFFRWPAMEVSGLALLWGALGVYGGAALIRSHGLPSRVTIGLVFVASALGLYARFTEIILESREDRSAAAGG